MQSMNLLLITLFAAALIASSSAQGIALQDDELLIPLMKKGLIPRGPPRFGKRSGGASGNRLHQFSLYRPMMNLFPRAVEVQGLYPYGSY